MRSSDREGLPDGIGCTLKRLQLLVSGGSTAVRQALPPVKRDATRIVACTGAEDLIV